MLLPSGPANTPCSVCRFDPGGLHVQLSPAPGTALQSPETGSQNRRYRDLGLQQRPHAWYLNRGNARKLRAICQRPGNVGSHRTAWWWMQPPSNRSPGGKFPSIREKNREFCKFEGIATTCPRTNTRHFQKVFGKIPCKNRTGNSFV